MYLPSDKGSGRGALSTIHHPSWTSINVQQIQETSTGGGGMSMSLMDWWLAKPFWKET